jgi:hypothetical protein
MPSAADLLSVLRGSASRRGSIRRRHLDLGGAHARGATRPRTRHARPSEVAGHDHVFHGALLAGLLLLGLAAGVVGRVDGWIRQHNISPSLLIAVTAWLSYSIAQEAQKQKTEQARQRLEAARRPKPPDPAR